jgi:hypothetical protein
MVEMKIVLKGGKGARRSPRAGKKTDRRKKKCLCATIVRNSLPECRPTEAEWEHAAADVGQRV